MRLRRKREGYGFGAFVASEMAARGWDSDRLAEESGLSKTMIDMIVSSPEGFAVRVGPENEGRLAAALFPDDPQSFASRYQAFEKKWRRRR